jgi:multiple sugar transport system substrate-binding protein
VGNQKLSRRDFLHLAALTSAGAALAACVPPATPAAEPAAPTQAAAATPQPSPQEVILNIMDNWGAEENAKGPPLHSSFADFMTLYPNIQIKEEVFGDHEIPTKVVTMFLAGEEPDLVFQNLHQAALDWLDDGVTIDVTNLAKEWGLYDQLRPDGVAEWTDDQGRLRAFPLEGYDWPVWYNTKILDEAGVEIPKTTDELIAAAKAIREAGYQPYATGGSEWTGQFDFYLTLATMLTDEEIRQLYSRGGFADNAHAVAGAELFVQLRDAGVFVDGAEGLTNAARNEMFYSEKAAIMHGGSWFFAECPDDVKEHVVLGGLPLPPGSTRTKPIIYRSFEGKGVWITRNGAAKMDAAEKFVKFFYQPEIMRRFVEQAAMTSPLKETPVDESKLDPLFVQSTSKQFIDDVEVALIHKVYVPVAGDENLRRVANEAWVPGTAADIILAHMDDVYKDLGIE